MTKRREKKLWPMTAWMASYGEDRVILGVPSQGVPVLYSTRKGASASGHPVRVTITITPRKEC